MIDLPIEFVEKMTGLLGEEAQAFFESYENPRQYGLRRNRCKCSEEKWKQIIPFSLEQIPWTNDGFYYNKDEQPGKHVLHEAGAYYIQEPSAMSPAAFLDVREHEFVADLCAAPGGKSTQIASCLNGTGFLLTNELYPSRARVLSQNIERMGIKNAVVLNENTEHLAELFPDYFDKIMVDAPCSGEGMFRKDVAAREEWSVENVSKCAQRQLMILNHAAVMLRYGGSMVYSTCTFSPEENEGVISKFLELHPEFEVEEIPVPEGFSRGSAEWVENIKPEIASQLTRTLRIFPHRTRGEGHYIAKLHKRGESGARTLVCIERDKRIRLQEWESFAKECNLLLPQGVYRMFGEELYLVPAQMIDFKNIKVERAGLQLGTVRKGRFEPAHALAMALKESECARSVSLSVEEAGRFIHGETIACGKENGWTLVTVNGCSLGWGKCVNGVMKNHYPKGLRR